MSSVWSKGKKHTKEEKDKISRALKRYYSNPLMRKKISESMKKYYSNPEIKDKFFSESYRKKMSEIKKKYYQKHPELNAEIDRKITEWWHNHPNIKKERSIKIKNLMMKHPDKFKKFLKYGSNPSLPQFKTKQNFKVRSRGEQIIANFLHDNRISSQYESKTLIFEKEGQICIPDFYLPRFKTYIEFYGGYPAAWKKKVMKNKLYKKYKIPCIFITPGELRNLDYYLKGELRRGKF